MTARTFIYRTLVNNAGVTSLVGGAANPRVFAKKTMTSSIEECPYIVYKLGNETSLDFAETHEMSNQFFQVWVHDYHDGELADYEKIDEIITAVKAAFFLASSGPDRVYSVKFLETSQDLNDDTLNTVFKYVRFILVKEEKHG